MMAATSMNCPEYGFFDQVCYDFEEGSDRIPCIVRALHTRARIDSHNCQRLGLSFASDCRNEQKGREWERRVELWWDETSCCHHYLW